MATIMPCPVCNQYPNPERDLDPQEQRIFELHLQTELVGQANRLAYAMERIANHIENQTIMVSTP